MSILVTAHEIRKSFAARPLFEGLTFTIETGDRIGLIGPNGAGKSTLLRILAGQADLDRGTLSMQRGLRVGFLEQVPSFPDGVTVHAAVLDGTPANAPEWERTAAAEEWLSKLDLSDRAESRVTELSGGWQKRVALARELARAPDLLLLDEPTNHLDVESIRWLENFLGRVPFATLTITHDRAFLQRVSTRIWELDPRNAGGLLIVAGDYLHYVETKEQLIQAQERREVILKNTLRRETEWLRRGAKARTTKQQARIQRHGTLSDEVAELETRNQSRTARISFQGAERNPKKLIEAKQIAKSLAGRTLFSDFSLILNPGARVGILGPNGCGKSTLIRCLLGATAVDHGDVMRADLLQVAYFEQNRETLDPSLSLVKTLCPTGDHVEYRGGRVHIRSYLDRFLFTTGQMEMAVGKLSGGEQSRLLIARLMLEPANLLVLDEPTNDLDFATLGVLEDCLVDFPGAILLVTHDRYFLDQVATKIVAFPESPSAPGAPRELVSFADLSQWETWFAAGAPAPKPSGQAASAAAAPSSAPAGKRKKLSYKDQREFDAMEGNIQAAETRVAELTAESARAENATNAKKLAELTDSLARAQDEVDRLYARWGELGSE